MSLDRSHIDTYLEMEKLLSTGKVRAIGVANYSIKYLEALLPKVKVVPAVNQIENHPQLPQQDLVDFCTSKGIHVTAYSPLGSSGSPLMGLDVVKEVAAEHGVSAGSVLLSYHGKPLLLPLLPSISQKIFVRARIQQEMLTVMLLVERGLSVLAKSVTPSRIEANLVLTKLNASDMEKLAVIAKELPQRYVYPEFGVNFGFPDKNTGIIIP